MLEQCGIPRATGYHTVFTTEEAVKAADELGYPVLLRPSYVLGGQNMIIAYSENGCPGVHGHHHHPWE